MVTKKQFAEITKEHQEHILAALFKAEHKTFTNIKVGLDIDTSKAYSIRVAVILMCELPDEIVKKIFVIQQDSNKFISKLDVAEFSEYAAELEKTGFFVPERDDLVVITPEDVPVEAYKNLRGKIIFMSIDTVLKGLDDKYEDNRELRDVLRHYGFVREKNDDSY
jgi:hypothetical protein